MSHSDILGTAPINRLIWQQAGPASLGILTLSLNIVIDAIFVGQWIGMLGIGALTIVMPIIFLISSIGMAIGVGGASIISRALGEDNTERAYQAFGNQLTLTLSLALLLVFICSFFQVELLTLFGGKGDLLAPCIEYFHILIYSIPFLAFVMMSNNVIRAEGQPKIAMITLMTPAIINLPLDFLLIVLMDKGIEGAAWATSISYIVTAIVVVYYFLFGNTDLKISRAHLKIKRDIVKEIFAIGGVTLARQGTISVMQIVLNNSLFAYGGEFSVSVWGIMSRMMMFINFPVMGLTQGFLPIAGYNYGAKLWSRLKEVINKSILYGIAIATLIYIGIFFFSAQLSALFTNDPELIAKTAPAMVIVFLANPLLIVQMIGSAYFQSIGKALPALFLSLLKQGIFLVPLILIMPRYFGILGIWMSFPIADILTALVNYLFLKKETGQIVKSIRTV